METKSYLALAPEILADLDPNSTYAVIREMVGSGQRVLDVGCGPGNLARVLRQSGNAVVGIDADLQSLRAAKDACERTIPADLDEAVLQDVVGDDRFDIVVFADVLEHLRNPARLLAASRDVLRERGFIVVSIPNVAHGAVRLALLHGRFDYQQLGILDDTHLHFYTRDSVEQLLIESGYIPTAIERTTAAIFEKSDLVPYVRREEYSESIVGEVLADSEADTLQFVISAVPVNEAQVLSVLSNKIAEHDQVIRTLRAQLAQAQQGRDSALRQLGDARALVEQLEVRRDQLLAQLRLVSTVRDDALHRAEIAEAEREQGAALIARGREESDAAIASLTENVRRLTAELQEADSVRAHLLRKIRAGEAAFGIEQATRRDIADAFERMAIVASQAARGTLDNELAYLRARSEANDVMLRARSQALVRVRAGAIPPPVRIASDAVYAQIVRRSVTLQRAEGAAPPRRSRWHRLRTLLQGRWPRALHEGITRIPS